MFSVRTGIAAAIVSLPLTADGGAAIAVVLLTVVGVEVGIAAYATITIINTTKNLTMPDICTFNFFSNSTAAGGIDTIVAKRKSNPAI